MIHASQQHYVLPSGNVMTVNIGDVVSNIKHPRRLFNVVALSLIDLVAEDSYNVSYIFYPEDTTVVSSIYPQKAYNAYGDEVGFEQVLKKFCLYHKRSKFPLRTSAKQFEPWLFCTVCGTLLEKFDPMNQDEDTDPNFIIRF